jgi:peptide/nickel transport system ATP-binding protein
MGVIFITHDLGVVASIADRVLVMYKGSIAEQGPVSIILKTPAHPYTKGLLACRPALHAKGSRLPVVTDFLQEVKTNPSIQLQTNTQQKIAAPSSAVLVQVKDLDVWYPYAKNIWGSATAYTKAIDHISFDIFKGETLGLVGESGCGKTTLGRSLLGLIKPTAGTISFSNKNITTIPAKELRQLRKDIQIIFQDPYSSLNPKLTIGNAIEEVLQVHQLADSRQQRRQIVASLLDKVSLLPQHANRYPHEFSGGQRQRIVIARALALNPSFIVCDESVSALDVSVQAQVLNLLNDLKKEYGFTVVFISHDLSVVHYISDRIMVMQKGKIIETGDAAAIYHYPKQAYTQQLIAAIPA